MTKHGSASPRKPESRTLDANLKRRARKAHGHLGQDSARLRACHKVAIQQHELCDRLRAWTYEMPDGKLEQFQVAVGN
jgi:hypothetical protein